MTNSICVVGDSITAGVIYLSDSERYVRYQGAFMARLSEALGFELKNHSQFGCTSATALKKFRRFENDIRSSEHTIIMLGGNDSDFDWPEVARTPEVYHEGNETIAGFERNYNELLDRVEALGSKPIAMNLIPVDGRSYVEWIARRAERTGLMRFLGGFESIDHWNEAFSLAVMRVAERRGVPVIDIRSAFLERRRFDGLFSEDGIHPSPRGHEVIYEYIKPRVAELIG